MLIVIILLILGVITIIVAIAGCLISGRITSKRAMHITLGSRDFLLASLFSIGIVIGALIIFIAVLIRPIVKENELMRSKQMEIVTMYEQTAITLDLPYEYKSISIDSLKPSYMIAWFRDNELVIRYDQSMDDDD